MAKVAAKKKAVEFEGFDVEMKLTKETKGTFVFSATDEDAGITTVYIRKEAFGEADAPKTITIHVE